MLEKTHFKLVDTYHIFEIIKLHLTQNNGDIKSNLIVTKTKITPIKNTMNVSQKKNYVKTEKNPADIAS